MKGNAKILTFTEKGKEKIRIDVGKWPAKKVQKLIRDQKRLLGRDAKNETTDTD